MVIQEEKLYCNRTQKQQFKDPILAKLREAIIEGNLTADAELIPFKTSFRQLKLVDGIIY